MASANTEKSIIKKLSLTLCTRNFHARAFTFQGMMILGYDVCHDKQNYKISYGALVATINDAHTSFFSCVDPHENHGELSSTFATGICSKCSIILISSFISIKDI